MAVYGIVQYTRGFLPDILLFTQAPILVWFDGTIILFGSNNTYVHGHHSAVCVSSSHIFWTSSSLDVPAGVTQQEESHTELLIHLPSAVHAFIFLARRTQPFLFLADREVEICVLTV